MGPQLQDVLPCMIIYCVHTQADQIHLIALKVQRKYYSEPSRESQRWASRHNQLVRADKGLPKQELPATMLSMDYTRVWYTDKYVPHVLALLSAVQQFIAQVLLTWPRWLVGFC